jgi:hypothetical protein
LAFSNLRRTQITDMACLKEEMVNSMGVLQDGGAELA